jgi:hypothetical protein
MSKARTAVGAAIHHAPTALTRLGTVTRQEWTVADRAKRNATTININISNSSSRNREEEEEGPVCALYLNGASGHRVMVGVVLEAGTGNVWCWFLPSKGAAAQCWWSRRNATAKCHARSRPMAMSAPAPFPAPFPPSTDPNRNRKTNRQNRTKVCTATSNHSLNKLLKDPS